MRTVLPGTLLFSRLPYEKIIAKFQIEDDTEGGDRRVTLKEEVKLKVLGDQLASLIMSHRPNDLSLSNLSSIFAWQYGYSLKPSAYGFNSIEELISNLSFAIKVNILFQLYMNNYFLRSSILI